MHFHRLTFTFLLAFLVSACGADDNLDVKGSCPTIDAEAHIAQTESTPDRLPVMLHILQRKCPVAGVNVFRLYPMNMSNSNPEDLHHNHRSHFRAMDTVIPENNLQITRVKADMPSMGHGTAKPPVVNQEERSQFTIEFQMPGSWRIELEFEVAEFEESQKAILHVDVR